MCVAIRIKWIKAVVHTDHFRALFRIQAGLLVVLVYPSYTARVSTMAVPPIAKATLQAALINAGSNVLAQGIKAYKNEV